MPSQSVSLPGMDGTGESFDPSSSASPCAPPPVVSRYPVREPLGYPASEQRVRQASPAQAPFVSSAESFSGPSGAAIAAAPPP
ncbi:hypothetical protein OY671_011916, partial [Metschnikowia pulcherrima]